MNQSTWRTSALYKRRFLAGCFRAWASAVTAKTRADNVQLRVRLAGLTTNVWTKNKAELVQEAVHHLGWTQEQAEKETVGQLRLHLKELKEQIVGAEPALLPKGMDKMLKADLVHEMQVRKMDPTGMTREAMKRDLKIWAEKVKQLDGTEREAALHGLQETSGTMSLETGNPLTNFPDVIASRMPPTTATASTTTIPSRSSKHAGRAESSDFGMPDVDSSWEAVDAPGEQPAGSSTSPSQREVVDFYKQTLLENAVGPEELMEHSVQQGLVKMFGKDQVQLLINTAMLELIQQHADQKK